MTGSRDQPNVVPDSQTGSVYGEPLVNWRVLFDPLRGFTEPFDPLGGFHRATTCTGSIVKDPAPLGETICTVCMAVSRTKNEIRSTECPVCPRCQWLAASPGSLHEAHVHHKTCS